MPEIINMCVPTADISKEQAKAEFAKSINDLNSDIEKKHHTICGKLYDWYSSIKDYHTTPADGKQ